MFYFLDRLDEDALVEVLLPKLADTSNLADLALTCTRLRQLVHGSLCDVLDFSCLQCNDLDHIQEWTAALPERFPSCEEVKLCIKRGRSSELIRKLMPALSR